MKKAVIKRILVIGTACLLLGCGKSGESREAEKPKTEMSEDEEVEKEEETEYKTIGKESEDAYKFLLTNQTGDEITGFAIKASASQETSQDLLEEGMKIEKEETVCVYYTPEKSDAEQGAEAKVTYDISLSYADGHVVEIVGLGLENMEEAKLCFEDEVGFVKYKKDGSEEVSTKETALALKAQKEAQEAAAAQAQKEKEEAEQAAAQAQAEAAAQAQQQYYEPEYSPAYDQPVDYGGGGQNVSQSGEGCLTDPVTNPGYAPVDQTGEGCLTDPVMNPNYDPGS